MGICSESGRKKKFSDNNTYNSKFSSTYKVDSSSNNKQISSESSSNIKYKALIPM